VQAEQLALPKPVHAAATAAAAVTVAIVVLAAVALASADTIAAIYKKYIHKIGTSTYT
jgi:hypothetical protein